MKRFQIFFFFCCISFFSSTSRAMNLASHVVEFHLPNGMTWLLVERHEVPVFAGYLSVKVGGVDEQLGKTGLAHMFEHLIFKGTSKMQQENEVWEIFSRNGSPNLNASTSKDATTYHADFPIHRLELWMKMFAEMFREPSLRNFYTERQVVLEERRMRVENDPFGKVLEHLTNLAFLSGPNQWSVIGTENDIANLTEQDAQKFYKKHYGTKNIVGVLVGDIDIAQTKLLIAKYFSALPAGEKTLAPPASVPQTGVSEEVKTPASPLLVLAYHKPTFPNPDQFTFDVAQTLLCDGSSSRLEKSLVFEKKIAKSVSCGDGFPGERTDNLMLFGAEPMKGVGLKRLQAEIEKILASLYLEPIAEEEMLRARRKISADFTFALSSNNSIASTLAAFQTVQGNWHLLSTYLKSIDAVKSDDVKMLAQKYFQKSHQVVIYRVKEKE